MSQRKERLLHAEGASVGPVVEQKSGVDLVDMFSSLNNYLMCDIPARSFGHPLQIRHALNFHKGGTLIVTAALMWYYSNTGSTACVYLSMHGTYGLLWLFKDTFYRDKSWDAPATIGSVLFLVCGLAIFYWLTPFLVIRAKQEIPTPVLGFCISLFTIGMFLHHGSDIQKYYVLSVKKGLITDGFFSICRNPNYLGEIFIYSSFNLMAVASDLWYMPWCWCLYVWSTLFVPNWLKKDRSMSRHPGFQQYQSQVPLILPKCFIRPRCLFEGPCVPPTTASQVQSQVANESHERDTGIRVFGRTRGKQAYDKKRK